MKHFSCPSCRSTEARPWWPAEVSEDDAREGFRPSDLARGHEEIVRCLGCGLLLQWPLPNPAPLLAKYQTRGDDEYLAARAGRKESWRRAMSAHLGPGRGRRILDVGCYVGLFLDTAREEGWNPEGVEPNDWARGEAANRSEAGGRFVVYDRVEHVLRSGAGYDVVTMWDVIEHLAEPRATLERLRALLAPGGRLLLTTPDVGSIPARLLGARWYCVRPEHLLYFDHESMRRILSACGFRNLRFAPYVRWLEAGYTADRLLRMTGLRAGPRTVSPTRAARMLLPVPSGDQMLVVAEVA